MTRCKSFTKNFTCTARRWETGTLGVCYRAALGFGGFSFQLFSVSVLYLLLSSFSTSSLPVGGLLSFVPGCPEPK